MTVSVIRTIVAPAAWIMATHTSNQVRDPAKALTLAQRAGHLTSFRNAAILDTLAAAYAATGQFDQAVPIAQKAIALARAQQQPLSLLTQLNQRLSLYRMQKPYRLPQPK